MLQPIIAGDTLAFSKAVPDYPASEGWTLTYRLAPRSSSGAAITFDAAADGDEYAIEVAASTTDGWAAGDYAWSAYVSKDDQRFTVDSGLVEIKPDPSAIAPGTDTRSHARKVLAAIEAVIERRATKDQEEYRIGERMLKHTPIPELVRLRETYRREVRDEIAAERLRAGLSAGYGLQVRL